MFTLMFRYDNNTFQEYEHITEIAYNTVVGEVKVPSEEIFKHRFPIDKTMYLYSENSSYVVSGKGIKEINVTKE